MTYWREVMEAKARELDEYRSLNLSDPQREIDLIRVRVAEEVETPYLEKLEALEKKLEFETRKFSDAKRQIEVLKLELA